MIEALSLYRKLLRMKMTYTDVAWFRRRIRAEYERWRGTPAGPVRDRLIERGHRMLQNSNRLA